MPSKREYRQWSILNALLQLEEQHKPATTREIATIAKLNTNGVSQTLGSLDGKSVRCLGSKGGDTRWKLTWPKSKKFADYWRACLREPAPNFRQKKRRVS
jgi:tRNA(Ile)-lysidine synthase TilS/MesJ